MQSTDHSQTMALITGGTQGLGLAVAHELVAAGCPQLILVGRSAEKGARAKAELEAKGAKVAFQSCDIAKADACEALLKTAHAEFGPINALLNSAALTTRGSILDSSPELFDAHINTNLRAPFYLMQGVANQLIAADQSGSMVNILSVSAYVGQSFLAPYAASKGGLISLTKNAANMLRHHKIRVNGVAPGWMDTPGEDDIQKQFHGADDNWREAAAKSLPLAQLVDPAQLAPLISYLLSPSSGVITGSIIDYDQQIVGALPE
jgi:NAD(P)-dependent dehydrogenase (short-subunit alcohol dehydrogenase family)